MPSALNVLLIDDNQATNFLHTRVLKRSGRVASIKAVTSAPDALDYLTQRAPATEPFTKPDLIFLDLNMPGMSGWEFAESFQALSADQRRGITIVILTTSLNPDDLQQAATTNQVSGFRQKPLTQDLLNEVVHEFFAEL